jgi:hypothetical protein
MFMVTSLLMPLLMLNMFIAILGNTYQRVQEEWKRNRYFQKVETIYDLELLMLWNYK